MKENISVKLDMKSFNDINEVVETTTKEEKKAVKWLKENKPIQIQLKFAKPFWDISEDDIDK